MDATAIDETVRVDSPRQNAAPVVAHSADEAEPVSDRSKPVADATEPRRISTNDACVVVVPMQPLTIQARSMVILATLAVCYTLYFAREILLPLCLAIVLCLFLRPAVRRMERWRVPSFAGAFVVVATLLAILGAGFYFLVTPATDFIDRLPADLKVVEQKLGNTAGILDKLDKAEDQIKKFTESKKQSYSFFSFTAQTEKPSLVDSVLSQTWQVLAGASVVIVLLYFLLASGNAFLRTTMEIIPTFRGKRDALTMAQDIEYGVSWYLATVALINVGVGVAIGVSMAIFGLENPVLWGVIAAALNFIPIFGCMVGSFLVFVAAMVAFDFTYAVWAPIIYSTINSIEGYLITPAILGRSMQLSTVMVILFLVFWATIWGVGGALLAVPLLAITKIICDRFERSAPIGKYLGG